MSKKISEWITKYAEKNTIVALKKQFTSAKPYPHLVLSNFFNPKKSVEILKALVQEPMEEKEADLFKFMQTKDLVGTNNKILKEFRAFLCSDEFVSFMEHLTGLKLKRGVIDMHGTLYQDTDFLLCHDDQLEGRKIAFLFYLSNLKEKDGGSLNLFNSKNKMPTTVVKKIIPQFNTFTFFEVSPVSFHEVEEVITDVQRIAIGGWFHGD
ncbi:MAG: 2OG-Fe(II) oxygenase family protein [Candidatus Woesearchaeota archaeon]|nr:2OG-Fe(II) oxygenase family protein [Candidatus Woesearchaeota archaeon]